MKWLFRLAVFFTAIAAVLTAVTLALPSITTWQLQSYLERLGARDVAVEDLAIDPTSGTISFTSFRSTGPDGRKISIGDAILQLDLGVLLGRRIEVNQLSVSGANIDIHRTPKGQWSVAGLPMAFGAAANPPDANTGTPWHVVTTDLRIAASTVRLTIDGLSYDATIDTLRLRGLSTDRPEAPTEIDLEGRTADGVLALSGTITPFAARPRAEVKLKVANLSLAAYKKPLTIGRIKDVAGRVTLDGTVTGAMTEPSGMKATYDGTLAIANPKAETTLFSTNASSLTWSGKMDFSLAGGTAASTLPAALIQGKAGGTKFRFFNKQSGLELTGETATFDLSKSGVAFRPGVNTAGTSTLTGMLSARFRAAHLTQPDTGLDGVTETLRLDGSADIALPAGTADFTATLDGTLDATGFAGTLKSAGIDSLRAATLKLDYRELALVQKADGTVSVNTDAALSTTDFAIDTPANGFSASASGFSGTKSRLSFARSAAGDIVLQLDGPLNGDGLRARATDGSWSAEQEAFDWTGHIALGGATAEDTLSLSGNANATDMKLAVRKPADMQARLGRVAATGIELRGSSVKVRSAVATDFDIRPANEKSDLPRAALQTLEVDGMEATDSRATAESLRASRGMLAIVRDSDGRLVLPVQGAVQPPAGAKQSGKTNRSLAPAFGIALKNGALTETRITFSDKTISPAFELTTSDFRLRVDNLDTEDPGSDMRVEGSASFEKIGQIDVKGTAKPDTEKLGANLEILLEDIELFQFDPYITRAIDRKIRQGRANARIDLEISDGELDAETSLVLTKLEVAPVREVSPGSGQKISGATPSVEAALSLLRDDKGVIRLSIPITGSIDDPQFDLSDAIGQAVANAMKETVLTAFKIAFPLGTVIAVADALGNATIAIRPIVFSPGSATLSAEARAELDEVAAYLRKNKASMPSICGYAVTADIEKLRNTMPQNATDRIKTEAIELSRARMDVVREALTVDHGIEANRLFTCAPSIEADSGASPRITITP